MRSFRRLVIFFFIYLPIVFASQTLGQMFLVRIDLYGLYFTAAVCGLGRTEAVIATIVSGFWMDVLQTECLFGLSALLLSALTFACHKQTECLFGLSALLLSALTFACHKQSWRVVLEAHARILSVCAQCFLQGIYLLCAFTATHTPMYYVRFYLGSFLISAVFTAILTPPLLRFQRKFFV